MKNLCSPRTTKKLRSRLIVTMTTFSLLLLSLGVTAFMQNAAPLASKRPVDAGSSATRSIPLHLAPIRNASLAPDAQLIVDSTFEAGSPWPAWTIQTSDNFGSSICNTSICSTNGGLTAAFSGTNWNWFGGGTGGLPENSTTGQSVTIPAGNTATLKFQMKIQQVLTPFADTVKVMVDGNVVQTFTEPASGETAYTLRTVDLTPYANGASRQVFFNYHSDDGSTNFLIDDVTLDVTPIGVVIPPGQKFTSSLSPVQEVPTPTGSPMGSGIGLVTLNAAENQITVSLSYTGMSSTVTAAHIHGSATSVPGQTAPIIFDLMPTGGTSGTNTATTFAITPAQVALLRSSLLYFNVHTTNNPNGECRGQIHLNDYSGNFDADGKTDAAVFRPSNTNWYALRSSDNTFSSPQWGLSTDVLVPGDYDGDAKADVAVFRSGTWYIQRSSDGALSTVVWGLSTDIPVPGDYDKDGKTDEAVFRPSTGNWFVMKSSGGIYSPQWGANGDKPVPADYDGDGKTDVAVFRPNDPSAGAGTWYILNSSNTSVFQLQFGANTDKLVPADYTGDGKADIAVFRPSEGAWYISKGTPFNFNRQEWGLSTDTPVPGDYDSDAKTDVAVFRNGNWYILRSLDNSLQVIVWGTSSDVPVPSIYVR